MAIRTLVAVAREPHGPKAARVAAAEALLNRGWGKPVQTVTGLNGEAAIQITIRNIVEEIKVIDAEPQVIDNKQSK